MTEQPFLETILNHPPKPKARLTGSLMGKGRRCRSCGHPTGPSCGVCGNSRVRAVVRPDSDHGFKSWHRLTVDRLRIEWWGNRQINGPLRVHLVFVLKRPGSRPKPAKTVQRGGFKIPNPRLQAGDWYVSLDDWKRGERVLCPVVPDIDRLTNAIFDGLTEVGVWHDDAQVASLRTEKWYAAKGEEPSIRIRVEAA